MRIMHNGEPVEVTGETLDAVLAELGYADAVVATAINGSFVPVPKRDETQLQPGDSLEVLAPMQGG
ncbi:MAG: sulfur carrier protein ThiS [Rhizobiaceae bacterium]|nr:sulfur carrier protein ThiS [Rhizobiaceae bacterium]